MCVLVCICMFYLMFFILCLSLFYLGFIFWGVEGWGCWHCDLALGSSLSQSVQCFLKGKHWSQHQEARYSKISMWASGLASCSEHPCCIHGGKKKRLGGGWEFFYKEKSLTSPCCDAPFCYSLISQSGYTKWLAFFPLYISAVSAVVVTRSHCRRSELIQSEKT